MPMLAGSNEVKEVKGGLRGAKPSVYNQFMSCELKKANVKGQGKEALRKAFKDAVDKWNAQKKQK